MQKFLVLVFVLLCSTNTYANAATHLTNEQLNSAYREEGYTEAKKIIKNYELNNESKLLLPSHFPFSVTHKFGKVDNEGKLKLKYTNRFHESLMIFVSPNKDLIQHKLDQKYKFKNGIAYYRFHNAAKIHSLSCTRNGLHYLIILDTSNLKHPIDKQEFINFTKEFI